MKVSLIILNYNTKELTAECIQSVYAHTLAHQFEVIVIDNASTDGSKQMLSTLEYENYSYIYNNTNEGFSKANNRAAQVASGEWLFFLNSDILFVNDVVGHLIKYMENHPATGITGPQFLNPDGSLQVSCRNFPNLLFGVLHFFPFLKRILKKEAAAYYQKNRDYRKLQQVDTVSAGALLISKKIFNRIDKFDTFSFMYAEDADICRKVRDLSLDVVYLPCAKLIHYGGQSSKLNSYKAIWSYYFAFYHLYKKYYFKKWAFLAKPFFFLRAIWGVFLLCFKTDKRITWDKK